MNPPTLEEFLQLVSDRCKLLMKLNPHMTLAQAHYKAYCDEVDIFKGKKKRYPISNI